MPMHSSASAHVARCRIRLAQLEAELVAACEQAAGHGHRGGVPPVDRGDWDRETWRRYLACASALDPEYGPPMRRLYAEIDHLQQEPVVAEALPVAA